MDQHVGTPLFGAAVGLKEQTEVGGVAMVHTLYQPIGVFLALAG